jgi:hypothetical protein
MVKVLRQDEYYRRALAAYFRTGGRDQPATGLSDEYEVNGREYVRLANVQGILAVYRVKPEGFLRRLKRWPKELEADR